MWPTTYITIGCWVTGYGSILVACKCPSVDSVNGVYCLNDVMSIKAIEIKSCSLDSELGTCRTS